MGANTFFVITLSNNTVQHQTVSHKSRHLWPQEIDHPAQKYDMPWLVGWLVTDLKGCSLNISLKILMPVSIAMKIKEPTQQICVYVTNVCSEYHSYIWHCISPYAAVRPVWYDYEGVYRTVKDLENLILKPMNKLYRTHQLTLPKTFADRLAES